MVNVRVTTFAQGISIFLYCRSYWCALENAQGCPLLRRYVHLQYRLLSHQLLNTLQNILHLLKPTINVQINSDAYHIDCTLIFKLLLAFEKRNGDRVSTVFLTGKVDIHQNTVDQDCYLESYWKLRAQQYVTPSYHSYYQSHFLF